MPDEWNHRPIDWFTPGTWPRCSCGFNPHNNARLNAHWASFGLRWFDDHGTLRVEDVPHA